MATATDYATICADFDLGKLLKLDELQKIWQKLLDFKLNFPTIPDPLFPDQETAFLDKLKKFGELMIAILLKMLEPIFNCIKQICEAVGNLIAGIAGLLDDLINIQIPYLGIKFSEFITKAFTEAEKLAAEFVAKVRKIVDQIKSFFLPDKYLPDQKNFMEEVMTKIQTVIRETKLLILKKITDIITKVIEKLRDWISIAWDFILDIPTSFEEFIKKWAAALSKEIDAAVQKLKGIIDDATEAFYAALNQIMRAYESVLAFINKVFKIPGLPFTLEFPQPTLGERLANKWQEFVELMKNWISTAICSILNKVFDILNAILDAIMALGQTFIDEVIVPVFNAIGGIISAIQALVAKINFCLSGPPQPEVHANP